MASYYNQTAPEPEAITFSTPPPFGWDKVDLCDRATVKRVGNSLMTREMRDNEWIVLFDIRFPSDGSIALYCFPNVGLVLDADWVRAFLSRPELRESVIRVEFDFKVKSIEPPGIATGAIVIYIYTTRYAAYLAGMSRTHNTRAVASKNSGPIVMPERPAADSLFMHNLPADMPEYHASMLTRMCNALLEVQSAIAPAADQTISQMGPGRFDITTSGYEGPLTLAHLDGVQSMAHVRSVQVKLYERPPALVVRYVLPGAQVKRSGAEANSDTNTLMPDGLRAYADDEPTAHQNLRADDLEPSDRSRRQRTADSGYTAGGPDEDGINEPVSESLFAALSRRVGMRSS